MVALSDNFLKHLETVSQVAANLRKVGSNSAGPGTNKEKVFGFSQSAVQFDRRKFVVANCLQLSDCVPSGIAGKIAPS